MKCRKNFFSKLCLSILVGTEIADAFRGCWDSRRITNPYFSSPGDPLALEELHPGKHLQHRPTVTSGPWILENTGLRLYSRNSGPHIAVFNSFVKNERRVRVDLKGSILPLVP